VGRRLAAALTAAVLGASLLAASSRATVAPARVPPLVVSIPGHFGGCDPGASSTTPATDAVLALVLPSAFTPGPLDAAVGDTFVISQAEIVGQSPQTVDYTIAPGAAWPDGTLLRPADLVRTWHERRDDLVVGDLGYRDVASVRPTASGTGVVVTFTKPYADWESLFNLIVPASTSRAACTLPSAAADPSIGPYELVGASRGELVLRANPSWPGITPAYAHVDVTTDPASPPLPGRAARTTYLPAPTLAQLQAITSTGGYASKMLHDTTVVSLDFALHGPAALARPLRVALALLVDRTAIVARLEAPVDATTAPAASHLYGQGQTLYPGPTGGPVSNPNPPTPPVAGATGEAAYGDVADPALAAVSLRASGYHKAGGAWIDAAGGALAVCLAVPNDSATLQATARDLAAQLARQGVAVRLQDVASSAAAVDALRAGTCALGIVRRTGDTYLSHSAASWLAPSRPAPTDLLWTGVNDPVVTSDAAAASGTLDPVVAATTWDAMDARLWDLMVSLPLYSPSVFVGWSPKIAGVLVCDTLAGFVGQLPSLLPAATKG